MLLSLAFSLVGGNVQRASAKGAGIGQLSPTGTVALWHSYGAGSPEETAFLQVIADVESANPGLDIVPEYHEWPTIYDDYTAGVKAGGSPDLILTNSDPLGDWARAGYVLDLDAYLAGHLGNFTQNAIDGVKVEDVSYGVPFSANVVALYYNKSLLTTPPATVGELLSLVASGKNISIQGMGSGVYYLYGFWNAFGGQLMDDTGFCVADQSTGFSDAMQYFLDLKNNGAGMLNDADQESANRFCRPTACSSA